MASAATQDKMTGFSHKSDVDESQSMASDFTYQTGGTFQFQTVPAGDYCSPQWDSSTAEGAQNFPDFSGNEEYAFQYGRNTPRQDQIDPVDYTRTWMESAAQLAPPMTRDVSHSSVGSRKSQSQSVKASLSRSQSRLPSLAQAPADMSPFASGKVSGAFPEDHLASSRMMSVPQYLLQGPEATMLSLHLQTGGDNLTWSPELTSMGQHMNPAHMQLVDRSPGLSSPETSWESLSTPDTALSSPPASHDFFQQQMETSHGSSMMQNNARSSRRQGQMLAGDDLNGSYMTAIPMEDQFHLQQPFGSRRQSSEGETARDHALYKNATPAEDGLFHCPFEGQADCNHKPEKLKCNYDKFVDSHLKPYRCKVESCGNARFSSTACLLRHEREAHAMHGHGDKPYLCTYESCDRSQPGNGFPRQWNLKDHMRRVHNDNSAGSGPTSPPAGGASAPAATQASTKGRKRKSDSQETAATTKGSARKSTVKAQAEAAAAAAAKPDPSIAEWHERRQRLEDIIRTLDNPSSARTVQDLEQVSSQAAAMMKISRKLSGPSNRKFSHSSG